MKIMNRVIQAFAVIFLGVNGAACSPLCGGEAARDPKQNAALQYWQAFSLMSPTEDKKENICTEKVGERLTEVTRDHLVQTSVPLQNAAKMLRRGTAMSYCDWGLNQEDGPGVLMPHLSKARHLARLIAFNFQLQAEDGKPNDGVPDVAAGLVFSRHVASDGTVISFLVHCAIDSLLIERSAFFLPQLDRDHLKELAGALDRLPPAPTSVEAVRNEKRVFCDWMKARLTTVPEEILKTMGLLGPDGKAPASLTRENMLAQVAEMDRLYDEMIALHALPLDDFEKKMPDLGTRLEKAGPLTQLCVPVLSRVRQFDVETQVRFQMYRAAIGVLLEGPDSLKRYPDPYDGKTFGYKVTDDGFVLTSNLKRDPTSPKLRVGGKLEDRAPKSDPPPKAPEF